jgi:hypothetical protein
VRLVSTPAQVGDPVRVTVAGVEVEGRSRPSSPQHFTYGSAVACSGRSNFSVQFVPTDYGMQAMASAGRAVVAWLEIPQHYISV